MYARPAITSLAGRRPKTTNSVLPTIAAIICAITLLVLIAATIVLALIPLYIPKKSVTVNSNTLKSNEGTIYVSVEKDHTTITGKRKKRAEGDLSNLVGCTFGTAGLQMIQNTLLPILPSNIVGNVIVSSASIAYNSSKRRKRFALSKRASSSNQEIVLVIKFYIIFTSDCLFTCQSHNGPILRQKLFTVTNNDIKYNNVPIYKDGAFFTTAPQIEFVDILYISSIIPAMSSSDQATVPPTVYAISTTTTPGVTGALGG